MESSRSSTVANYAATTLATSESNNFLLSVENFNCLPKTRENLTPTLRLNATALTSVQETDSGQGSPRRTDEETIKHFNADFNGSPD